MRDGQAKVPVEQTPAATGCALDRQPTLVGPTLVVRPLRADDFDNLYAVGGDELLWAGHPARDRWRPEVFRAYFDDTLASGGALLVQERFGTSGAGSARVVGTSRYQLVTTDPDAVEIGWTFVARSFWGTGANRELKELMLNHAFGTLDRVVFKVGEQNWRSQRAVEKLGARRTDAADGTVTFELRRADWQGGRLPAS